MLICGWVYFEALKDEEKKEDILKNVGNQKVACSHWLS